MKDFVYRICKNYGDKGGPFSPGYWELPEGVRYQLREIASRHTTIRTAIFSSPSVTEDQRAKVSKLIGSKSWVCGVVEFVNFFQLFDESTVETLLTHHDFEIQVFKPMEPAKTAFFCTDVHKQVLFNRDKEKPFLTLRTYREYQAFKMLNV